MYGAFYGHKRFAVGVTSGYDHQEIMLEGSQKQKKSLLSGWHGQKLRQNMLIIELMQSVTLHP